MSTEALSIACMPKELPPEPWMWPEFSKTAPGPDADIPFDPVPLEIIDPELVATELSKASMPLERGPAVWMIPEFVILESEPAAMPGASDPEVTMAPEFRAVDASLA
ncbi:MAG: hypothetical protein ACLFN0_08450, partial [Thermovirgaceae bacterium]